MNQKDNNVPITAITCRTTEANQTGRWRSQRPVIDEALCDQCGVCWMFCPDMAVSPGPTSFEILYRYCKGCGICSKECPKGAIALVQETECNE